MFTYSELRQWCSPVLAKLFSGAFIGTRLLIQMVQRSIAEASLQREQLDQAFVQQAFAATDSDLQGGEG